MALKNSSDTWTYDQDYILQLTQDYFQSLFTTSQSSSRKFLPINHILSPYTRTILDRVSTLEEIFGVVNSFQSLKAPGPDGLHSIFYQYYWNIVGKSMEALRIESFYVGAIPSDINCTFICFIPKTQMW